MNTNRRIVRNALAPVLLGLLLCGSGCFMSMARKGVRAAAGGDSKAYKEVTGDPVALATVKTILVLPFDSVASEPGFDAMDFSTRLANKLNSRGKVRILYPKQGMMLATKQNRQIARQNNELQQYMLMGEDLNKLTMEDRNLQEPLDPVRNVADAVKIGRLLKADAVVVGLCTDFDPYSRPRLSLTLKVVATGQSDAAAMALAQMTQWGVPRSVSTARGELWFYQQNFDARDGNIGRNVAVYGTLKHTEEQPFDIDIYTRSMNMYYDYVGAVLTNSLLDARNDAIWEAEQRALAEADRKRLAQEGVRNRLRALVDPFIRLPDGDAVLNANMNARERPDWRPDIYNIEHPRKKAWLDRQLDPERVAEYEREQHNKRQR